jgi:16S rRNA (cytosine1402-N4)-methyltransferase
MAKGAKKKTSEARNRGKKRLISEPAEYDYHLPVLLKESVDYLVTDVNGIYADMTLGGGGHSNEILQRLGRGGNLLSFDKDIEAIEHCKLRFSDELNKGKESRLVICNECFGKACSIIEQWGNAHGILMDLGLSSRQLDESRRGFTYRSEAPLDMRFASEGVTAEEFLHAASEEEIRNALFRFGEEPFSNVIARRLVQRRRAFPLKTTSDLREIVESCVPVHLRPKSLSRVFQAIRIVVNKELKILEETLDNVVSVLNPSGRIVVISYHSLEDRIVKTMFRKFARSESSDDPISLYNVTNTVPILNILTKKPIIPPDEEIIRNPRARSAKMRVAEKR